MPQNRYDNILREYNQDIINLSPANQTMRIELALEIKKILEQKPDLKILEMWIWEWDLTKYILQYNPDIKLDCLDISQEMLDSAKQNLWDQNINFIQGDACNYLDKSSTPAYGIILSAWTIHNFPKKDQKRLFEKIYDKLQEGWIMIIMDKIYTDNTQKNMRLLRLQNARYRYLNPDVEHAIKLHEMQDFDANYQMQESQTILLLKEIWFRWIEILDRIQRDLLLVARK